MAKVVLTNDEELQLLRHSWGWLAAFGVSLIVVGILAIGYPAVATLLTVEVVGFFLIAAAAFQFAVAIWARRWGGFFLHLATGMLSLFLGFLMIERPGLGAAGYTLVLALFFIASGLFRVIFALDRRFTGWGWTLLGGVVSFMLGIFIWRLMPESALWVIGTVVGIDMLFAGWACLMLGLLARKVEPR